MTRRLEQAVQVNLRLVLRQSCRKQSTHLASTSVADTPPPQYGQLPGALCTPTTFSSFPHTFAPALAARAAADDADDDPSIPSNSARYCVCLSKRGVGCGLLSWLAALQDGWMQSRSAVGFNSGGVLLCCELNSHPYANSGFCCWCGWLLTWRRCGLYVSRSCQSGTGRTMETW